MTNERPRKGAPWTDQDDAELRRRCDAGEFLEDIAKVLGRSSEGVRTRANSLGIACRSGRRSAAKGGARPRLSKVAPYRLICRRSDGATERIANVDAADDAAAIAAAKSCPSSGGCEVWRTGSEPEMIGRF